MKGSVRWVEDVMFEAESDSGHSLLLEGPAEQGGLNRGMRPMELMLLGVGGCSSFDVVTILKKARQKVIGCVAHLEAERGDEVPSVFTRINIHFVVSGSGLKEKQVSRAVELSAEKYCSASIMLSRGGVDLTHSYEIQEQ
ncbi:MAG: osmotically inducible protein C [Gammaproteobacteria bacterium]|jgi:putative redox protein|nr:osmotically inducible protein C [Gammaproteobacteria bacterium]|tara:strand:- start:2504 stop:2923 length:420 start_codon:yes stop_codon:yes gene_type:complete